MNVETEKLLRDIVETQTAEIEIIKKMQIKIQLLELKVKALEDAQNDGK